MGLVKDRVVLVTGASRGMGKGIALALGGTGATVYVTGRSEREGDAPLPGTVGQTAAEVTAKGGQGIPVVLDHADDRQVRALVERITEESGRLDILVNCACQLHDDLVKQLPFWEKSLDMWDIVEVGLRSHYVICHLLAPMMARQGEGLIVNISSHGARCYMHGPIYGAQKAGMDKMTFDMACDLKPFKVAAVGLWSGMIVSERVQAAIAANPGQYDAFLEGAASPEYAGLIIDALAADPDYMAQTGKLWIARELADFYEVLDTDGKRPDNNRDALGGPVQFEEAMVY